MPEPIIETLEDWNMRLGECGCCPMPSCLTPSARCEYKNAERESVGWTFRKWRDAVGVFWADGFDEDDIPCPDLTRIYKNVVQTTTSTYPDSPSFTQTFTVEVQAGAEYNVFGFPSPNSETGSIFIGGPVNNYSGGVFSGTLTSEDGDYTTVASITFSNPITLDSLIAELDDKFAAVTNWTDGGYCGTPVDSRKDVFFFSCRGVPTQEPAYVSYYQSRFRWKIPDAHLGSYFKITWDVLNEPTGWNDSPPTATRTYFAEDQTYEWTGAAGGGTDRYSDWYEIPVPDFAGTRGVVNVRYECYSTTDYGNKPQVTGKAVTLPDT